MLELLAQAQQQPWILDVIEKLARTPINQVLLFALAATVVRIGFHWHIKNRYESNPIPIPHWLFGLVLAIGAAVAFSFGITVLAILVAALALYAFSSATKIYNFDTPVFFHDLADALVYAGILVFLIIRPFALQTFRIPSGSMLPTLIGGVEGRPGDLLIVNKAIYRYSEPKAGDIVVFKPPTYAKEKPDEDVDFVKRLIGAPGQVIEIKGGHLFRDGVNVNEPYVLSSPEIAAYLHIPVTEVQVGSFQPFDFKLIEYPKGSGRILPIIRDASHGTPGHSLYDENVRLGDRERVWDYPAQPVPPGKYLMMGDNRDGSFDGRYWGLIDRDAIVGKAWLRFWPINRFGLADRRP